MSHNITRVTVRFVVERDDGTTSTRGYVVAGERVAVLNMAKRIASLDWTDKDGTGSPRLAVTREMIEDAPPGKVGA